MQVSNSSCTTLDSSSLVTICLEMIRLKNSYDMSTTPNGPTILKPGDHLSINDTGIIMYSMPGQRNILSTVWTTNQRIKVQMH